MSQHVQLTYDPRCGEGFKAEFHDRLQQWLEENHEFSVGGTLMTLDEAHVVFSHLPHIVIYSKEISPCSSNQAIVGAGSTRPPARRTPTLSPMRPFVCQRWG